MSTRTMDVPMARPITHTATGYAPRANSNLSPAPTLRSRSCSQQLSAVILSLEATRRPTREALKAQSSAGTPTMNRKSLKRSLTAIGGSLGSSLGFSSWNE